MAMFMTMFMIIVLLLNSAMALNISDDDPGPSECVGISAGGYHTCMRRGRDIVCLGAHSYNAIGISATQSLGNAPGELSLLTAVPFAGTEIPRKVVGATQHSCALFDSGVRCWGRSMNGRTGGFASEGYVETLPFVQFSDGTLPVDVDTYLAHTCVLFVGGKVRCFGYNAYGMLGQGVSYTVGDTYAEIAALNFINFGITEEVIQVGAGAYHSCALFSHRQMRCWGRGEFGALGNGKMEAMGDGPNEMTALSDVPFSGTAVIEHISAGGYHNCVLFSNGGVRCFGYGFSGRLGTGNTTHIGNEPGQIEMLEDIPFANVSIRATRVHAGGSGTCVIFENGGVRCFGGVPMSLGYEHSQEIGDEPGEIEALGFIQFSDTLPAIQVSRGNYHTCILFSNHQMRCFGDGNFGATGIESPADIGSYAGTVSNLKYVAMPDASYLAFNQESIQVDEISGNLTFTLVRRGLLSFPVRAYIKASTLDPKESASISEDFETLPIAVTFEPRERLKDLSFSLIDDVIPENAESILLSLVDLSVIETGESPIEMGCDLNATFPPAHVSIGEPSTMKVTIAANDPPPPSDNDPGGPVCTVGVSAGFNHTCVRRGGFMTCFGDGTQGKLGIPDPNRVGDEPGEMDALTPIPFANESLAVIQVVAARFHTCALFEHGHIRCFGGSPWGMAGHKNGFGIFGDTPGEIETLEFIKFSDEIPALQVSAKYGSTCALFDNGKTRCFGHNGNGRLGQGSTIDIGYNPGEIAALGYISFSNASIPATQISSGISHTCVLFANGGVKCFGSGAFGALGTGNTEDIGDAPGEVEALEFIKFNTSSPAIQISAGEDTSCVLFGDVTIKDESNNTINTNQVRCFGRGENGRLGTGDTADMGDEIGEMENLPFISFANSSDAAIQVSTNQAKTCTLFSSGGVRCFGSGILGYPSLGDIGDEPGEVESLGFIPFSIESPAVQISSGHNSTCVTFADSSVICFGGGYHGSLGMGTEYDVGDHAGEIEALGGVPMQAASTFAFERGAVEFNESAGNVTISVLRHGLLSHTVSVGVVVVAPRDASIPEDLVASATTVDVLVFGPGETVKSTMISIFDDDIVENPESLTLKLVNTTANETELQEAVAVCNVTHTFGSLAAIGEPSTIKVTIQASDLPPPSDSDRGSDACTFGVAAGYSHTCMRIVGEILCWGRNEYGSLGVDAAAGIIGDEPGEIEVVMPVRFSDAEHAIQVTVGLLSTCIIFNGGKVRCFGFNGAGQLGIGNDASTHETESLAYIAFSDTAPAIQTAVGGMNSTSQEGHTCVLFGNGGVRCFGSNVYGQLGANSQVASIGDGPGDIENLEYITFGDYPSIAVAQISAGQRHSCALFVNGRVRCFGDGSQGQRGSDDISVVGRDAGDMESLPYIGFANADVLATQISAGNQHTCVLFDGGGGVRCFGHNGFGQLGLDHTNNIGDDSGEMSTLGFIEFSDSVGAVQVSAGFADHTCVLFANSRVRCFGKGGFGRLGSGDTTDIGIGSGVMMSNLDYITFANVSIGAVQVSTGRMHSCVLFANGRSRCFGNNDDGKLAIGSTEHVGTSAGDMQALGFIPLVSSAILSFSDTHTEVDEADGHVNITVVNTGLASFPVTFAVFAIASAGGDGVASAPGDIPAPYAVTHTLEPYQRSAIFSIPIVDDSIAESAENLTFALANATAGPVSNMSSPDYDGRCNATAFEPQVEISPQRGTVTVQIKPSDPYSVYFAHPAYDAEEDVGVVTLELHRTMGVTGAFSVNVSFGGGTATGSGEDYDSTTQTILFSSGDTWRTFTVAIVDDSLAEGKETFIATLDGIVDPSGQGSIAGQTSATVSINPNDPFVVQFNSTRYAVEESDGTVTLQIDRTPTEVLVAFDVELRVKSGSATGGGVDFNSSTQTVSFATNDISRTVDVFITQDSITEWDETFVASLVIVSDPSGQGSVAGQTESEVTIIGTDALVRLQFEPHHYISSEGKLRNLGMLGAASDAQVLGGCSADPFVTHGPRGHAISFPGNASACRVHIPTPSVTLIDRPWTIAFWFRFPSAPGNDSNGQLIMHRGDISGTWDAGNSAIYIPKDPPHNTGQESHGQLSFVANGFMFISPAEGTPNDVKWHHFAFTSMAQPGSGVVYVDGVAVASMSNNDFPGSSNPSPPVRSSGPFVLGGIPSMVFGHTNTTSAYGDMDDFAWFARALEADEIVSLMQNHDFRTRDETSCGNGQIDNGEECDDGNVLSGDGCDRHCYGEIGFSCMEATFPCNIYKN